MSETINGAIAVVTGASSGIGAAVAKSLGSHGAVVHIVGRDTTRLQQTAERIREVSPNPANLPDSSETVHCIDLTEQSQIDDLRRTILDSCARIDILVHSAGSIHHGELQAASAGALDQLYASNVRAPYLLTQALLPMLKLPRGQVVFINSSAGLIARRNAGQFSATQHALKALTDAFREELNEQGVRICSVYPGRTATPRTRRLFENEGRDYKPEYLLQPEDIASIVTDILSLPWTAEVTNLEIRPMLKSY